MQSPHESSMDPMDLRVKRSKVKVTMQGLLKMFSYAQLLPFYTYLHETSHAVSPWVEYGPYGLWGQKVKGQGHNARITEKGFWRITASPLHLSLWNFTCSLPMSQVCALWNLGSKGQRSRSQCNDYWKWFLAHNCFPFTPIFMKLHMQSPHESSMDPMDFGVKRSKVKVTSHNCFPYLVHNLDSLNWLPRGVFCPVRTAPF